MTLRIYNTLTRKKDDFIPLQEGKVTMYCCGITAYDFSHIGHTRAAVVFDVIYRYLTYRGYDVTYVRNYTDIDDKIINRANKEGIRCEELAEKYIGEYEKDMGDLRMEKPTFTPRATAHIREMISLIEQLFVRGIAYTSGGDVFYSVSKFKEYGKLSGKNLEELQSGARVDVDERKANPLDFVLWKASKPGEPAWDSPWGKGRPGWHIECSAMSQKYLGETFDIHGGGQDLIFPHHENEIAQSEGATGKPFARYWIHNGFVNINQEKMSKSLGNFFTIRDILDKFDAEIVRLFLLSTHYRSPIDFSDANLKDARAGLDRFYTMKEGIRNFLAGKKASAVRPDEVVEFADRPLYDKIMNLPKAFEEAMDDDFNTALAIGLIYDLVRDVNKFIAELHEKNEQGSYIILAAAHDAFEDVSRTLGIFLREPEEWFQEARLGEHKMTLSMEQIEEYIHLRNMAREKKDWAEADRVRKVLDEAGVTLFDRPGGTVWKPK